MSKIQSERTRKVWQPLNRSSQMLATIAVIAVAAFQIYSWHSRLAKSQSAQTQPTQQLPEKQNQ